MMNTDFLGRAQLLLGDDVMQRVAQQRVIVFGCGGVGSWCIEALVRSGIRHLTIVDFDRVSITNINRQLMATQETVGQVKVEAMRDHLQTINPEADITIRNEVYNQDSASSFLLDDYDYVIDAIDSLPDKQLLIEQATRSKAKLFSSMGAALKLDPTRVQVAEFWKVKGCPLARALRQRFKKSQRFPARKFQCVFSEELVRNQGIGEQANGSLVHITAIFGFTLAGLVISDIQKRTTLV